MTVPDYAEFKGNHNPWPGSQRVKSYAKCDIKWLYSSNNPNDTLAKIFAAILNDKTLSVEAKIALMGSVLILWC
jgi:hypothetical protein